MIESTYVENLNTAAMDLNQLKQNLIGNSLDTYLEYTNKLISDLKAPTLLSIPDLESHLSQLNTFLYQLNEVLNDMELKKIITKEETTQKYHAKVLETEGTLAIKDAVALQHVAQDKILEQIVAAIHLEIRNKISVTLEFMETVKKLIQNRTNELYLNKE